MSEQHAERRQHVRRPVLVPCRLEGAPSHVAMRLTDLSAGGCFVQTPAVLPEGSRVTLYATFGEEEVPLVGRVVRAQPGHGFGFAIDVENLPEGARRQLEQFLREVAESAR